jgi:uncharacterized metal-binding protein
LSRARPGIFCLGGLPTQSQLVLDKTRAAQRIVTVDGCPLNCARKIVEQAGFVPYKTINLVEDCSIKKGPPQAYGDEEMQVAVKAIVDAVRSRELKSQPYPFRIDETLSLHHPGGRHAGFCSFPGSLAAGSDINTLRGTFKNGYFSACNFDLSCDRHDRVCDQ